MANLSEFRIVFSSSALIRLNKDTFEEQLRVDNNNWVDNKSTCAKPLIICKTELVEPPVSFEKEAASLTHEAYQMLGKRLNEQRCR